MKSEKITLLTMKMLVRLVQVSPSELFIMNKALLSPAERERELARVKHQSCLLCWTLTSVRIYKKYFVTNTGFAQQSIAFLRALLVSVQQLPLEWYDHKGLFNMDKCSFSLKMFLKKLYSSFFKISWQEYSSRPKKAFVGFLSVCLRPHKYVRYMLNTPTHASHKYVVLACGIYVDFLDIPKNVFKVSQCLLERGKVRLELYMKYGVPIKRIK